MRLISARAISLIFERPGRIAKFLQTVRKLGALGLRRVAGTRVALFEGDCRISGL